MEESSATDGVLEVGVNAWVRPVFIDRPLLTLAVASKTGRHTRRTTRVAPEGSEREHRVSPLGTGKEVQKLRRETGSLEPGCRWGGFPAFTSHQEHALARCSLNTVRIPDLGGASKKGQRDKTLSPSLLKKTCSGPWDRSAHQPVASLNAWRSGSALCGCRPVTVIRWLGEPGVRKIWNLCGVTRHTCDVEERTGKQSDRGTVVIGRNSRKETAGEGGQVSDWNQWRLRVTCRDGLLTRQ